MNDLDDTPCLQCGQNHTLDTGWECTECGWDGFEVYSNQGALRDLGGAILSP